PGIEEGAGAGIARDLEGETRRSRGERELVPGARAGARDGLLVLEERAAVVRHAEGGVPRRAEAARQSREAQDAPRRDVDRGLPALAGPEREPVAHELLHRRAPHAVLLAAARHATREAARTRRLGFRTEEDEVLALGEERIRTGARLFLGAGAIGGL